MNDQHQEGASKNGWSSRMDTTGTATAEPVDRRWFEEALRAQGFLVEPPALDDAAWSEPLALDATSDDAHTDDEPLAIDSEIDNHAEPLDAAAGLSVAEAAVDAAADLEPDARTDDGQPADDDAPAAEMDADHASSEPDADDDAAAVAASIETEAESLPDQPAEAELVPKPESRSHPVIAAPSPASVWPIHGETPARLAMVAPVVLVAAASMTTRQAVAPTTLSPNVPPVPTAALAARLSRGTTTTPVHSWIAPVSTSTPTTTDAPSVAAPSVATGPVSAQVAPILVTPTEIAPAEIAPAEIAPPAPSDVTPTVVAVAPVDPWTLPALQADLAAERLSGATSASGDVQLRQPATPAPVIAAAAVTSVVADQVPAETAPTAPTATFAPPAPPATFAPPAPPATFAPPAPPATFVPADVPETPETVVVEASALTATAVVADAQPSAPVTSAATASVSTAPFAPLAGGIAAIARRPPVDAGSAAIDDGDSDLWGLVADPSKSASAAGNASVADPSTQSTTILLTVFVAIVVVVLVLGFIYLFTNLL